MHEQYIPKEIKVLIYEVTCGSKAGWEELHFFDEKDNRLAKIPFEYVYQKYLAALWVNAPNLYKLSKNIIDKGEVDEDTLTKLKTVINAIEKPEYE